MQNFRELTVKLLKISVKKFNLFARAFWNYSPPPLIRSGHANLILNDGRVRPIFVELSSFSLVFLLPRAPVPHRNITIHSPHFNLVGDGSSSRRHLLGSQHCSSR